MPYLAALVLNTVTIFWVVLAASVIGLLVETWPAKPWKLVAGVALLVLAVMIVAGG